MRELSRRLEKAADEVPLGEKWEARRLRQRNEQALELSQQLQTALQENEQLEERAQALSSALEEASGLLKEANLKHENLRAELQRAQQALQRTQQEGSELKKAVSVYEVSEKSLLELLIQKLVSASLKLVDF